jgi:hypothetical protein
MAEGQGASQPDHAGFRGIVGSVPQASHILLRIERRAPSEWFPRPDLNTAGIDR